MRQIENHLLETPQISNMLQEKLFRIKVSRKKLRLVGILQSTFWKYDKSMIYYDSYITYQNFPYSEAKNGEKNG